MAKTFRVLLFGASANRYAGVILVLFGVILLGFGSLGLLAVNPNLMLGTLGLIGGLGSVLSGVAHLVISSKIQSR